MRHAMTICLLVASTAIAGSQQAGIMPAGFDQIHIGMDWRSVVSLRPHAEIMNMMPASDTDLKPDPRNPKAGLTEKLASGPFERVLYSFEDGVLVAVMFGKEAGKAPLGEREGLIRKVAGERGMPVRIEIVGNRRDQGVLTWQDQSLHINVIVSADDTKTKKGVFGFQIMNRKYAERIKAIGASVNARKDSDLQDAEKEKLDVFKSKIEKIISVENGAPQK